MHPASSTRDFPGETLYDAGNAIIPKEVLSMCIAVPAEVIEIREGNTGLVDYGDLKQVVRLDLVDVQVGDFVLVHVGFAIQKISREEGLKTREIFRQVYAAMQESD